MVYMRFEIRRLLEEGVIITQVPGSWSVAGPKRSSGCTEVEPVSHSLRETTKDYLGTN